MPPILSTIFIIEIRLEHLSIQSEEIFDLSDLFFRFWIDFGDLELSVSGHSVF